MVINIILSKNKKSKKLNLYNKIYQNCKSECNNIDYHANIYCVYSCIDIFCFAKYFQYNIEFFGMHLPKNLKDSFEKCVKNQLKYN